MNSKQEVMERTISIVNHIVSARGRFSVKDCMQITGLTQRSAQRYMNELEELGYVYGDGEHHRGYRATEKAKQIFRGEA